MIHQLMKRAVLAALPFFIATRAVAQDPIHQLPPSPTLQQALASEAFNDTLNAIVQAKSAAKAVSTFDQGMGGFIGTPWTIVSLIAFTHGDRPKPAMAVGPAAVIASMASIHGLHHPLPRSLRDITQTHDSAFVAVFTRTYNSTLSKRQGNAFALGSLTGVLTGLLVFVTIIGPALAD